MATAKGAAAPVTIWRLTDGKRGHENQTLGLVRALGRLRPVRTHDVAVPSRLRALWHWARGEAPWARELPDPELILGAGHATNVPMLAAARARSGRTVVLMKPSLPQRWFDLCIVPEHDLPEHERPERGTGRDNLLVTRGVLNRMGTLTGTSARTSPGISMETAAPRSRTPVGLVLVGGPSRHHGWDEGRLQAQVRALVERETELTWLAATSRRTPSSTAWRLEGLAEAMGGGALRVVRVEETDPEWLPARLAEAAAVWVTEDSASMVYEALTAGAPTGVLDVPRRAEGRVSRGLERLGEEGRVTPFEAWREGRSLRAPDSEFDEAARCAEWINRRLLTHG